MLKSFKKWVKNTKLTVHLPLVHSIESEAECRTIFMHSRPRKCGSFLGTVIGKQANLSMGLRKSQGLINQMLCALKIQYLQRVWNEHQHFTEPIYLSVQQSVMVLP